MTLPIISENGNFLSFDQSTPELEQPADDDSDDSLEEFFDLCKAIGYLVLHWAIIEQNGDNWVNVAFNDCGGKKSARKATCRDRV
jgi:hypothetical protein